MSLQILVTVIVACLLGGLASFGLYKAAQPAPFTSQKPLYTYGTSN